MKRITSFLIFFSSFVSFFAAATNDNSTKLDGLVDSLVKCDSSFFSYIYNNQNSLKEYADIQNIDNYHAYIPVKDRAQNDKNVYTLHKPIYYKSLSITGYYDSAINLDKYGHYYFWGFVINNDLKEAKASLDFLEWQNMEDNYLYIANTKIRYEKDAPNKWHKNSSSVVGVKTIPAFGTVEKLLLLEKTPDMTLLVCSIQGFLAPELLTLERPDLMLDNAKQIK